MPRYYEGLFYAVVMDRIMAGLNAFIARQIEPGQRILDAGCGTGTLSMRLARSAREVVAIDHSAPMLAQGQRRLAKAGLANLRFDLADFADGLGAHDSGSFDLAVMVMVLHEMPQDVRAAALAGLTRVARRVLLVDFQAPQPWSVAGVRNRFFELAAGSVHFRAFRDFCARGGVPAIAGAAGHRCAVVRSLDSGSLGLFEVKA